MNNRRNQWLLGIAVVLAALRFGVVPWLQAQAEARERLQVLTQRLDRSVGVRQNRGAILESREALAKAATLTIKRFPEAADPAAFRLEGQRQISTIVTGAGLKVVLFDWLLDGRVAGTGLAYGRARLQVEGSIRDLIAVEAGLEGAVSHMVILEADVSLPRGAEKADDSAGTLSIVADLYYTPKEAKP